MSDPPPYWRNLWLAVRPLFYGLGAALDRYFKVENSKYSKLIIEQ